MRPPLFVDLDGRLLVFRSAGQLGASAEPDDVRAGVYGAVFDWEGRRLELRVVAERRRGFGGGLHVLVEEPLLGEPDAEGLRELLDRTLRPAEAGQSLDDLRSRALEEVGFS